MSARIGPDPRRRALMASHLGDWPTAALAAGCRCGWRWRMAVRELPPAWHDLTLWRVSRLLACAAPGCGQLAETVALEVPGDGEAPRREVLRDDHPGEPQRFGGNGTDRRCTSRSPWMR